MTRDPILFDADPPPVGGGGSPPPGAGPARHRPASVVLREEGESVSALMDPANRSLADALKITFRLLQAAMVVLFGLFAFSGLQEVREGESGLRLMFGRLVESDVPPGIRFALPPPVGEIVRVTTGKLKTHLTADGQVAVDLRVGDEVTIRRAPEEVRLLRLGGSSFFRTLRQKLHWSGSHA